MPTELPGSLSDLKSGPWHGWLADKVSNAKLARSPSDPSQRYAVTQALARGMDVLMPVEPPTGFKSVCAAGGGVGKEDRRGLLMWWFPCRPTELPGAL
eukprot:gene28207-31308_t